MVNNPYIIAVGIALTAYLVFLAYLARQSRKTHEYLRDETALALERTRMKLEGD